MKSVEIIVSARVQGVGYRYFAYSKARLYQLKGYVKNLGNGKVKIIASGDESNLREFINIIRKGPDYSWVHNLEVRELTAIGEYHDFSIKY